MSVVSTETVDVTNPITSNLFVIGSTGDGQLMSICTWEAVETSDDTDNQSASFVESTGVRRPYRGIQIKPESFAVMSIVEYHNENKYGSSLRNSSVDTSSSFTSNFLVNSVSESRNEKHQPVSTFGKDYVYFFGEQPRQITFNVTLLNTENFRWEEEWWYNYEHHFRGTRLAANSEKLRIKVDETIIYGYMINCSSNKDSNNPHAISMTFTLHVTEVISFRSEDKIGSHLIANHKSSGKAYGYLDLNATGALGNLNPIAIGDGSKRIREYNANAYLSNYESTNGWVRLSNSIQEVWGDTAGAISKGLKNFSDFLYGRNLVIPIDAAYDEFTSGNPQFSEGTSAYEALQKRIANADKKSIVVKGSFNLRPTGGVSYSSGYGTHSQASFTDNADEYPFSTTKTKGNVNIFGYNTREVHTDVIAKHLAKEYGIEKDALLAGEGTKGVPKFNEYMRALGKGAFVALNVGYTLASRQLRRRAAEDADGGTVLSYPTPLEISFVPNIYYSKGNSPVDVVDSAIAETFSGVTEFYGS